MSEPKPTLRIRNEFEFDELASAIGGDRRLVARDFALVAVAAQLTREFGDSLCFKGGFVLRHVYGHNRFSKDVDTTRINPPKTILEPGDVRHAITRAGVAGMFKLKPPQDPKRASGSSLDFPSVPFSGPVGRGHISVEVSYRDNVILGAQMTTVGEPYYEPFDVPVMKLDEIVAEKLRTVAQRELSRDLADLAMLLRDQDVNGLVVQELVPVKFEFLKSTSPAKRLIQRIEARRAEYDDDVRAIADDAPTYEEAREIVLGRLPDLLP